MGTVHPGVARLRKILSAIEAGLRISSAEHLRFAHCAGLGRFDHRILKALECSDLLLLCLLQFLKELSLHALKVFGLVLNL